MEKFIDPPDRRRVVSKVDFAEAARVEDSAPIRGQRLFQQLNEQRPIYAIMADEYHDLLTVLPEDMTQSISGAGNKILKRFASGKAHKLR